MHTSECMCPETTQAPSPQQFWDRGRFSTSFFHFFHPAAAGAASTQLRAITGKGNKLHMEDRAAEAQLCFGYMVLGLMHLVGKKGLLWLWKPSWERLWGKIPIISIDRNKDIRLKRCFVSDTKSYYGICYWLWEKKPQISSLKSSESSVLEKRLLSALNV